MVSEPMAHWWKPLHLQYYDPGVGSYFPGKITSGTQLGFYQYSGVLFFPVSANIVSKLQLWLNKHKKIDDNRRYN